MKSFTLGLLALLAGAPTDQSPHPTEAVVLTFGLYQSDKPTELYKKFTPVLEALQDSVEGKLGRSTSIELVIHKTYDQAIDALAKGEVDFVRFGPASYVLAKEKEPGLTLLAIEEKKGARRFTGLIVAQSTSPLQRLSELGGHSFAFGDENSTIGRYLAQAELLKAGVSSKQLSNFNYLGRHDKVAMAVEYGDYDAGSLKASTFNKINKKGQMKVLFEFENITKPWIARKALDPAILQALQRALLELKDEDVLSKLKVSGLAPVKDSEFDFIRVAMTLVEEKF